MKSDIALRVENLSELRPSPADNAAAGAAFGCAPAAGLAAGLGRLIADGAGDHPAADLMAARHELAQAGLLRLKDAADYLAQLKALAIAEPRVMRCVALREEAQGVSSQYFAVKTCQVSSKTCFHGKFASKT